jgi:GNAT superfamily N-acetyltransferase
MSAERTIWVPFSEVSDLTIGSVLLWNRQVWGDRIPGYDETGWREFYQRCRHGDYSSFHPDAELAWALFEEEDLVGSIALVYEDDLASFSHLSPWMAAFVIAPELRHQGRGRAIVSEFESLCRQYGVERLYLWTDIYSDWYRSLGYYVIEHSSTGEIELDVMAKSL